MAHFNFSDKAELYQFTATVASLKSKGATVELIEKKPQRTLRQNRAIHLYCDMIATVLNDLGKTFKYEGIKGVEMELRYTQSLVKETMWKPIQKALFNIESTTELTTSEVSEVSIVIEKFFSEQGIDLPFPGIG